MASNAKSRATVSLFLLTVMMLFAATAATAQTVWVDPVAVNQLEKTVDFVGKLDTFNVQTLNTFEEIIEPGQKVQMDFAATLTLKRPAALRVERLGEVLNQTLVYDGSLLTLYDKASGYYAQAPAPGSIEGMLDFARLSLGIEAPLSDLLYRNVFPLLMQDVYSARVLGSVDINGQKCTHLAFSRPDVDFQIWVAGDGEPLPCKYVVTDKNSFAQPSYTVVMNHWNLAPDAPDSMFIFSPPNGSAPTEFMRLDANGGFVNQSPGANQ